MNQHKFAGTLFCKKKILEFFSKFFVDLVVEFGLIPNKLLGHMLN